MSKDGLKIIWKINSYKRSLEITVVYTENLLGLLLPILNTVLEFIKATRVFQRQDTRRVDLAAMAATPGSWIVHPWCSAQRKWLTMTSRLQPIQTLPDKLRKKDCFQIVCARIKLGCGCKKVPTVSIYNYLSPFCSFFPFLFSGRREILTFDKLCYCSFFKITDSFDTIVIFCTVQTELHSTWSVVKLIHRPK